MAEQLRSGSHCDLRAARFGRRIPDRDQHREPSVPPKCGCWIASGVEGSNCQQVGRAVTGTEFERLGVSDLSTSDSLRALWRKLLQIAEKPVAGFAVPSRHHSDSTNYTPAARG